MANGDYLPIEELNALAKPINAIKQDIDGFARENDIEPFYYRRGWVHAELKWKNPFSLYCRAYLTMNDDKSTFDLGIAVHRYLDEALYQKVLILQKKLNPPFDGGFVVAEIKRGVNLCNSWKFNDLSLV